MSARIFVAELIGTFSLVLIGPGSAAIGSSLVAVAFAHGLIVLSFAYTYGYISGTHINPAVTIGLWVGRQIDFGTAVGYIVAQVIGGILGAGALWVLLSGMESASGMGATVPAAGVSDGQAFLLEVLLTFLLVNVIFHTAVSGKGGNLAPVAIGLTLVACILMGGPLTGASLNPARTLGPALFSTAPTAISSLWIYWLACPLGGILAALVYNFLRDKE